MYEYRFYYVCCVRVCVCECGGYYIARHVVGVFRKFNYAWRSVV